MQNFALTWNNPTASGLASVHCPNRRSNRVLWPVELFSHLWYVSSSRCTWTVFHRWGQFQTYQVMGFFWGSSSVHTRAELTWVALPLKLYRLNRKWRHVYWFTFSLGVVGKMAEPRINAGSATDCLHYTTSFLPAMCRSRSSAIFDPWFGVSLAVTELFHAFSLDYFSGCNCHKTGGLVQSIIQCNSLFDVTGQESCE